MRHFLKIFVITALFMVQCYGQENFIVEGTDDFVDTELVSRSFNFGSDWRGPTGSSITLLYQLNEEERDRFGEPSETFQFIPDGSSTSIDLIFDVFPSNTNPPFIFLLSSSVSDLVCRDITKVLPGNRLVITAGTTNCNGQYTYKVVGIGGLTDTATSTVIFSGGTPPNFQELNQVTSQGANTLYGLLGTSFQTTVGGTQTIIINATDLVGEPRGAIQWYFTAEGSTDRIGLPGSLAGVTIDDPQTGTSILQLEGISQVHLGQYTAEATNEHGTDTAFATITQGVAPFITEGTGQADSNSFRVGADRAATLGETVIIRAEDRQSNPSSTISWSYSRTPLGPFTAVSSGASYDIQATSGGGVGTDSTLTISNIQDGLLGYYRAEAVNVHGSSTSSTSLVGRSPSIREGSGVVAVGGSADIGASFNGVIGSTVTIVAADTEGFPVSDVQWQRVDNGVVTDIVIGERFSISNSVLNGQRVSTLTINGVQAGDRGEYIATATNGLFPDDVASSLVGAASTCRSGTTISVVSNGDDVESGGYFDTVNADRFLIRANDLNGSPHGTVAWTYSRTLSGSRSSPNSQYTSVSTPANSPGTISFFNLEDAALGYYFAEISNQFGSEECTNLVGSALQFATGSGQIGQNFLTQEGSSVDITASFARGFPQGAITWRGPDGTVITPLTPGYQIALGSGTSVLSIASARQSDFGTYTASASNVFGFVSGSSTLTQDQNVIAPTIDLGSETNTDGSGKIGDLFDSTVGDTITITATDITGVEASGVTWSRIPPGEVNYVPIVTNGVYTVSSATNAQGFTVSTLSFPVGSDSFGTYRAEARNSAGNDAAISVVGRAPRINSRLTFPKIDEGQSGTVDVGAQVNIAEGASVSLTATDVEGEPDRTFTWFYRNTANGPFQPLPGTNNIRQLVNGNVGTLEITNIDRSQYGDYLVQATNQFGESTNVTTRIGGPPIIRVLTGTETDGEGEIGQDFIIPVERRLRITACVIGGFPPAPAENFEFRERTVTLQSVQQPAPNDNCFIYEEGEFELTCGTTITARTQNVFGFSNEPESRITFPPPIIVEGTATCSEGSAGNAVQIGSRLCLYNQDSFQITCSLVRTNIPDFTFEWQYQGSVISSQQSLYQIDDQISNGRSVLTVSSAGVNQAGRYTCRVVSKCEQTDAASSDLDHFDYQYLCDESAGRTVCQVNRNGAAPTSVLTSVCDRLGLAAPVPCEGCEWTVGQWSTCSDTTCHRGRRTRTVQCLCNNVESEDETDCSRLRPKPESMDRCGPLGIRCMRPFMWRAFPFGLCSANCGASYRRRTVECVSTVTANRVSDVECNELFKPPERVRCAVPRCNQCRDNFSEEDCRAFISLVGNCNAYPYYVRMDCCATCFRMGL